MSGISFKGHYKIEKKRNGVVVEVIEFDNTLTTQLPMIITELMTKDEEDLGYDIVLRLKWLGVGTGYTPATIHDWNLETEVWRGEYVQQSVSPYGAETTVKTMWVIPSGEAVAHIYEIGVFMGGSSSPNSGYMMSRVNVDIEKTSSEELVITRTDTIKLNV